MQMQQHENPSQLLRIKEVMGRTGLGRTSIYNKMAEGTFPRSIRISEQARAWLASDIDQWISDRVAESQAAA